MRPRNLDTTDKFETGREEPTAFLTIGVMNASLYPDGRDWTVRWTIQWTTYCKTAIDRRLAADDVSGSCGAASRRQRHSTNEKSANKTSDSEYGQLLAALGYRAKYIYIYIYISNDWSVTNDKSHLAGTLQKEYID